MTCESTFSDSAFRLEHRDIKLDSCRQRLGTMVRFKHRYLLVQLIFPASLDNPLAFNDDNHGGDSRGHKAKLVSRQQDASAPIAPPVLNESGIVSLLRDSLMVNFGDIGAGEVGGTFNSESSEALVPGRSAGSGLSSFAATIWAKLGKIQSPSY